MDKHLDIDAILADWPYQPGAVSARLITAGNGREVIQLRVELGLLQMETDQRPDGQKPGGATTYLELMDQILLAEGSAFELSDEQAAELDREFVQYYHRRICWLALREFDRAVRDADHTLRLMDFAAAHSTDEQWVVSHEQYRPFVLFHRTQAAALSRLTEDGPEAAVEEINHGLERIREAYAQFDAEEEFGEDELAEQLRRLQEWIRENYNVGRTLQEQLDDAVASEQYELAARLRDQMSRRPNGP